MIRHFLLLLCLALTLSACDVLAELEVIEDVPLPPVDAVLPTPALPALSYEVEAGATPDGSVDLPPMVEVFFTDPNMPGASSFRGGQDVQIAAAIDAAQTSIDLAAHEFNLWSLRDALVDAHQRGVRVRVVAESNNLDAREFDDLKAAGIPVLGDRREGLMHNKFVVIDGYEVWTGSVNFTVTDMYLNNNHLLRIRSVEVAQNYTTEFEEMFEDDLFGPDVRSQTPYPDWGGAGLRGQSYFSPDDGVMLRLVELVEEAQQSVYFLAFSFTSDELADALIARARAGVQVAGVFETAQVESNRGGEYQRLRDAGIAVRLDGNERNMHHKVIIIDGQIVVAGSFNFSYNADQRNDENVLVLYSEEIAQLFLQEFEQIYADGR